MTFDELFGKFMTIKILEVKESTRNRYKMDWKFLGQRIGQTEVTDFGAQNARFLLAKMVEDGLGSKTAKDRIALLKQLLLFAACELGEKIKPIDWKLRYPACKRRSIQCFTESETKLLFKSASKEIEDGVYSSLPVLLSLLTGMRIGEVLGLQWQDVDNLRNVINVRRNIVRCYDPDSKCEKLMMGTPKTINGFREIPLLPILKRILRRVGGRAPQPNNFIIGDSDKPRYPNTVRDSYTRLLNRNKLPNVNFHGLRHTFATMLVESGGDIKTISMILGHANVATTLNLYVHPSLDAKQKVVKKAFRKLKT